MQLLKTDTYIVNGNITQFLGTHTTQYKQDILHSNLLGQLIAKGGKNNLSSCSTALGKLYWDLSKITITKRPKKLFSLLDATSTIMSDTLQKTQLQELNVAFSAITKLSGDDPALLAFLNTVQSENSKDATFMVSPMLTIVCENKKIYSFQVSFETSEAIDVSFLDRPIPEQIIIDNIETSLWITHLLEDQYSGIRDLVVSKLGSKPRTHLFPIHTEKT
jgi:hypothetical protein